ncbi:MAG: carbon monoxide dehydrogenase subunit G [Gemmatimonadetes bacterium]|nr:carbon monoxide dehydrogenase subunit G [Gemmatimonadota bacterium]MYB68393.1 carbon monoxide dehydrogenase subunit G [Gemmatimonadota bacterium]
MQLAGSHTFRAPRQVMWDLLNDPEVLARITPGVDTLEQTGPGQYQAVLHIKMGPINSTFNGALQVVDSKEPESYRLLIDVDGKIGQIAAKGHVRLAENHETTTVEVEGGSQLTGRLASMGQRLLSGVARMFTNQFFKALEREVSIRN